MIKVHDKANDDAFEKFEIPFAFFVNNENRKQIINLASDFYQMRDLPDFVFSHPVEPQQDNLELMWPYSGLYSAPDQLEAILKKQLTEIERNKKITASVLNNTVIPLISILIDSKKKKEATRFFEKYIRGHEEKIKNISILADYYFSTNQLDQAMRLYQKDLERQKKINNRVGVMKSYAKIGKVRAVKNQYKQAENLFEKALDLSNKLKDNQFHSSVMESLATIYQFTGNTAKARAILKESKK